MRTLPPVGCCLPFKTGGTDSDAGENKNMMLIMMSIKKLTFTFESDADIISDADV